MSDHAEELIQLLTDSVMQRTLRKVVFSTPRRADAEFLRVSVRPIEVRGQWMLQFASQTATQEFHENRSDAAASEELLRLARRDFRNVRLTTDSAIYEARTSRKGKCFLRKEAPATTTAVAAPVAHNKSRNYLIPEGVPCPFLIHTGVMTKDGAVRASHSRKFAQINRFLEFINDIVDHLPTDRTINVIDFGCGKSYLTFATQYLFANVLKRDCRIIGLDRRSDVVGTCTQIVKELKLTNLDFSVGNISSFEASDTIDLVISLHACDMATDEALAQAVKWNSRAILSVPCCQHELNEHLTSSSFSPLTAYGLTKERFASLTTDAMRATLMTAVGYPTQILEFIEMEHTPKNLLLRSVRRTETASLESRTNAFHDVLKTRSLLNIPPLMLERRLQEWGFLADAAMADVVSNSGSHDAQAASEGNSLRSVSSP